MPFEYGHAPEAGRDCRWGPGTTFGRGVKLGDRVVIGAGTVIGDHVTIGDDAHIGNHVILAEPTRVAYAGAEPAPTTIGAQAIIRSGTVIYSGVQAGDRLETGNYATIREDSRIGTRVRIGSYCDLQGQLTIGNFVSLHSNVHLGQFTVIEDYAWLFPYVITINDRMPPVFFEELGVHIGPYAVVGARTFLHPGARLGRHAVVAANSVVEGEIPDFALAKGDPAKKVLDCRKVFARKGDEVIRAYPWPVHVKRDYPWADDPDFAFGPGFEAITGSPTGNPDSPGTDPGARCVSDMLRTPDQGR